VAEASLLVIACGALAKEIVELKRLNGWSHLKIQCLPAELHNRPEKISDAVRSELVKRQEEFEHIFVAYADCGTGGELDKVLAEFGVERLPGAHCYDFYAGVSEFAALADKNPQLMAAYFGNYKRLVYLSQSESKELHEMARQHAAYLGLEYVHHHTGLANIERNFGEQVIQWQN
jgi:hypothetical protein